MKVGLFILHRMLALVLQIVGAVALVFGLIAMMPFNPVILAMFGYQGTAQERAAEEARLEHELGIDVPVYQQFLNFFIRLVEDQTLGNSWTSGTPTEELFADAMKFSFLTFGIAFIIYTPLALILGIFAAKYRGSKYDHSVRVGSTITYSIPPFLLGIWFILMTLPMGLSPFPIRTPDNFLTLMKFELVPIFTTILIYTGFQFRFVRAHFIQILGENYIRTARAKGLGERTVLMKHALRNALPYFLVTIAVTFPIAFSGVAALEIVFGIPGGGVLMVNASLFFDWPTLIAGTVIYTTINSFVLAATDIIIFMISPKQRFDFGSGITK
jgi:peptide/nickel transport system permease protein